MFWVFLVFDAETHKENGRRWVSTSIDRLSWEIAVQLDDAQERRRREEHV